ncbi:MAG: type II CAAX endopeptidase family protein [Opitutales bacterium]|nr:type II CAAX endopeptidase family protein [Opitutales bacterium]
MLAALFNEPPNFYVFIGFSLFCGTSIFLWVSRLPKAPVLSPRPWGLNISWVDFGLFLSTCFLAILLAQICLSLIYKALDPDEFRKATLATIGMQGAILVCILILRNRYPKLFGDSLNRPDGLSAANAIPFSISAFIKFLPLLWIVTLLANIFLYMIGINPEQQKLVEMMREAAQQRPIQFAGLAFGAIILAPLAEETLFRGYIYRFLRAKSSQSNAAIFSSLLFALIHFNLTSFAPLFLLSLLLTWTYEKTGNLLTPILFHAIFNAHTVGLILISPILPEPNF